MTNVTESNYRPPPFWRDPLLWLPLVITLTAVGLFLFGTSQPIAIPATPSPTLTPEPSNPAALALLKQMEAAMNRLATMKAIEVMKDDQGRAQTTMIEYAAPDKVALTSKTGGESIGIGNRQWAHNADEALWSTWKRVEPFRFPKFDDSQNAVDVQLGSEGQLDGRAVRTLTYAFLGRKDRFDFKVYADPETLLLRRMTMDGPGHHMVTDYVDYAPTVVITPPPLDRIAPTPTAIIP